MINPAESGQGKIFFERLEITGEQGDATDKQFVFPRQCLVLGDSEVGKTSLVKSLTGKPFDPGQQKTQGIDQCLVDNKWENCNLKDLVFGDLWKFLKSGQVAFYLSASGKTRDHEYYHEWGKEITSIISRPWQFVIYFCIFIHFMLVFVSGPLGMKRLAMGCLIIVVDAGLRMFRAGVTHYKSTSNLRFTLATFAFILSNRGIFIGSYLPLVISYFDERYIEFARTRAFLMLGAVTGIAFVTFFILIGPIQMPFGTCQLVKNRNFIVFFAFYRLLLSIIIGLIIGFVAAMSVTRLDESCTETLNTSIPLNWYPVQSSITHFVILSPFELILELVNFPSAMLSIQRGLWGPFNILLILAAFYHLKLAITTPIFYFVITYPLVICFSFCQECFRLLSMRNTTGCLCNNFMILALMATGQIDTAMLKRALKEKYPSLMLKRLLGN